MESKKLKLKANHTWKARPGYSICVIERGLVRFDYPGNWIVEPGDGAVHLHDRPPSTESCDLGVSIFPVPVEHIQELSLKAALRDALGEDRQSYEESEIHRITRPDMEIVWIEQRYIDPDHKRDARFRVALARGATLCLISMNYWANYASGLERVWNDVLTTLVMGLRVEDPTAGPTIQ